ncbi:NAD(P)H-hydrate dehydratase [Erythrobacter sp.]|jgi:hydroxyethylthiazole kinase-like uncharacterized protein yjeF|uniref:NAD(P)H-hydrate dehydratase n=1 Tax=Erythrobacter sp. TaxID=1042 RepID=UPI002EA653D9|nr:NAD(P)H-hydrate dehydratase [Erythrobacter sp.]
MSANQILTAEQMGAAERALFDAGTSEFELMQEAAGGAAEWIRRIACGRSVTVLCGPGNNGGDGYVIAQLLRRVGNAVRIIAPVPPSTETARQARDLWGADVQTSDGGRRGDVFVDCLFGSGLSRPLSGEHALLLRDLAHRHDYRVAIDVPSGIASDTGEVLNERVPRFDLTLALGAWKFAHHLLPGRRLMGATRLVPLGIAAQDDASRLIEKPEIAPPRFDAHKYRRGLAVIVAGAMPGAPQLAAAAAMRAGAGYVKLWDRSEEAGADPSLVVESGELTEALSDERISAVLIGPGLGRDARAEERLQTALAAERALVCDADALHLLTPEIRGEAGPIIATPHDGELDALCRRFPVMAGTRMERVRALARISDMVVVAKGPDTLIAAPDGRQAIAPPAPTWLSIAGTGDVLAGIIVSRAATGRPPFEAACEAVWLHGAAARLASPAFTPDELVRTIPQAVARCL